MNESVENKSTQENIGYLLDSGLLLCLINIYVEYGASEISNIICDRLPLWYQNKCKRVRVILPLNLNEEQRLLCNICYENEKDHVFVQCGHSACAQCKDRLFESFNGRCHVCREQIQRAQTIFL